MPLFRFEAIDEHGSEIRDVVDAPDESEARARIRELGYFVTKLEPASVQAGLAPACPVCKHPNAAGAQRCEKCGAWLTVEGDEATETAPLEPTESTLEETGLEPGGLEARILSLLERGQKIEAIKVYREETGVGLRDAKEAVELLAQRYQVVGGMPQGRGCTIRIGAALVILGALVAVAVLGR